MSKFKCLFVVNGLGMGNSTRCHAIMQKLYGHADVHVITSGNGLLYMREVKEIASLSRMDGFFYANAKGKVSVGKTLLSAGELMRLAWRKSNQLKAVIDKIKPDLAVCDSEYAILPLKRAGIPVIAFNNSDVVTSLYLGGKNLPGDIRAQFWAVEMMDYLFHKSFFDLVISPSAVNLPVNNERFRRVGLVVRNEVEHEAKKSKEGGFAPPNTMKKVCVMLSGSVFASKLEGALNRLPYEVDVVGREGASEGAVKYHGKLLNSVPMLASADILVINGGFSAVSEALALNKPTIIIPVPGHAEQYINGTIIEKLGRGFIARETDVVELLARLHNSNSWGAIKPWGPHIGIDGAAQAASEILKFHDQRKLLGR
ncbi:MAG: hypothetical protein HZB29_06975 [Nitrospinae bacterium]|nr:hypothetical protein [Nitrospinota bacterium]